MQGAVCVLCEKVIVTLCSWCKYAALAQVIYVKFAAKSTLDMRILVITQTRAHDCLFIKRNSCIGDVRKGGGVCRGITYRLAGSYLIEEGEEAGTNPATEINDT